MNDEDIELIEWNSNIFRDFGDSEAGLKQTKTILATRVIIVLDERSQRV